MTNILHMNALRSAKKIVQKFWTSDLKIVLESSNPGTQLCPEEAASQAVDEKTQWSIDSHEQAGYICKKDKPKWRVKASYLIFQFSFLKLNHHFLFWYKVSKVIEWKHVFKFYKVENSSGETAK